jgi:putative tryptophan/tyrosine transport system substrate-binding protein
MKRREFISGSAGIFACTLSSLAMAANPWRIGQVFGGTPDIVAPSELARALLGLGYIDGKDVRVQTKFVPPNPKEMKDAVLSLLPEIDLLVVWGTIGGVAAKSVAAHIPVVFVSVGAPVDIGLVESLSHPGGNMTGITFEAASETYGKRLQILKEILPSLSRLAVLGAKGDPNFPFAMMSLENAARLLKISVTPIEINLADDLRNAFDDMRRSQSEALIVVAGALTYANSKVIAELSLASRLPSCHGFKETVAAGGLVSLGPDLVALGHQEALLIDKIIKGARPADIPVEQPTQYIMTINLKTAKALGLALPATLLASADEVIE